MKYNYSDLSPKQFEQLVLRFCFELFGIGTQVFADGPDGGRDARYEGVADIYPSKSQPWKGVTVIQAKHTIGYNEKFSDSGFFSANAVTSTIVKESVSVKKLVDENAVDNYILFSNRKLPANANEKILDYLAAHTGLQKANISLVGIEQMESWLKKFTQIPAAIDLNPFDMLLNLEPDELANIITAINEALPEIKGKDIKPNLTRIKFEDKNVLNQLEEEYSDLIKMRLSGLYEVEEFLSRPENESFQEMYETAAEEINAKITIFKRDEHRFSTVLEKIIELLIQRDNDCKKNKSLTRLMVYYMYYRCDIGEKYATSA